MDSSEDIYLVWNCREWVMCLMPAMTGVPFAKIHNCLESNFGYMQISIENMAVHIQVLISILFEYIANIG